MLFDDKSIDQYFSQLSGDDYKHRCFLLMSTVSQDFSNKVCQQVSAAGGSYAECPVMGNKRVAVAGNLQVRARRQCESFRLTFQLFWQSLLGCSTELLEPLRELLGTFGLVRYVGVPGKAMSLKLALNNLVVSSLVAFSTYVLHSKFTPSSSPMYVQVNVHSRSCWCG